MELIPYLVAELDRETQKSRHALEQVPADSRSWKPHERSMEFGYLADMVATIPSWIAMILNQDELDIAPKDGKKPTSDPMTTSDTYSKALDGAAKIARAALAGTTIEHLHTNWKLLAGGQVVSDTTRLEFLSDTINHWVHHRGQMTVYLRLMGAKVPALYGPSADDTSFG